MQTGMERAREVADGERSSTQSSEAANDDDGGERGAGEHGSSSGTSPAEGSSGSSGADGEGRHDGDSHQHIPELYAPGRLLYIRRDSGADEWLEHGPCSLAWYDVPECDNTEVAVLADKCHDDLSC